MCTSVSCQLRKREELMNRATGALELLCSEEVMVVGIGVVAGLSNQL
jgi:hypothetical protein